MEESNSGVSSDSLFKFQIKPKRISERAATLNLKPAVFDATDEDGSTGEIANTPEIKMSARELQFCREEGARLAEAGEFGVSTALQCQLSQYCSSNDFA